MKKTTKITALLIIISLFVSFTTTCFAATDQVKLFMCANFENTSFSNTIMLYAALIYNRLGYNNVSGGYNYVTTGSKSDVMSYINTSGNNYGFFVYAHGNEYVFVMNDPDSSTAISPSDISGNWHLVFLNACSNLKTDSFAQAFKTTSAYQNRAILGWYHIVTNAGASEFLENFYKYVGSMGLRDACLAAAAECEYSTPIRIYGDTSWYGWAW